MIKTAVEYLLRIAERLIKRRGSDQWPRERATVWSLKTADLIPGGLVEIAYSYTHDGQYFSGTHQRQFLSYFEANLYAAGFPKGSQIVVRVKPDLPTTSIVRDQDQIARTDNPHQEWVCENPKCTVKFRVKVSENLPNSSPLYVHCPVCGTKQVSAILFGGVHYGLEYDDGSGWKDGSPNISEDSVPPDVPTPVPPRVVVIHAAIDRPDELLIESWMKEGPKIVELGERFVFGRVAAYADVSLPGRMVAKRLFEIRWNADNNCHEVEVYPCVYPPSLNGVPLKAEGECRPLSIGDLLTIGPFTIEYTVRPPLSNERHSAEPV